MLPWRCPPIRYPYVIGVSHFPVSPQLSPDQSSQPAPQWRCKSCTRLELVCPPESCFPPPLHSYLTLSSVFHCNCLETLHEPNVKLHNMPMLYSLFVLLCKLTLSISVCLALYATASKTEDSDVVKDDTFFYGQSPPVYPSRKLCLLLSFHPV